MWIFSLITPGTSSLAFSSGGECGIFAFKLRKVVNWSYSLTLAKIKKNVNVLKPVKYQKFLTKGKIKYALCCKCHFLKISTISVSLNQIGSNKGIKCYWEEKLNYPALKKSPHRLTTSQVNSLEPLLWLSSQSGFERVLQWNEEIGTIFSPKS